jgi:hypothetical protein
VLVPKVSIFLISQDLNIGPEAACKTWEGSGQYGRLTFPASDKDIRKAIEKGKGKGHTTIAKEAEGYCSDVLAIQEEVVVKEEPVERVTQFQTEIHDGHEVILID